MIPYKRFKKETTRAYMVSAINMCDGDIGRMAEGMGVARTVVYRFIKDYGLQEVLDEARDRVHQEAKAAARSNTQVVVGKDPAGSTEGDTRLLGGNQRPLCSPGVESGEQ